MFLQLVVKKQSKIKQKKQLTNLNGFMLEKELCNQLAIKKQNKAKQKRKEKNLKIGYSSKSGHVETKNKQTVVVKIMVVVIIITIKLLTTERTQ